MHSHFLGHPVSALGSRLSRASSLAKTSSRFMMIKINASTQCCSGCHVISGIEIRNEESELKRASSASIHV